LHRTPRLPAGALRPVAANVAWSALRALLLEAVRGAPVTLLAMAVLGAIISVAAPVASASASQVRASPQPAPAVRTNDPIAAPGYEELSFPAPVPGTYQLPPLGKAADGKVLDSEGNQRSLAELLHGRITVLAFVYRSCPDPNGCPLANFVMSRVRDALNADPALHPRTQLLSLSLDPHRDTPQHMAEMARALGRPPLRWLFLTTPSADRLEPILDAYGQSVRHDTDAEGRPLGTISHILRVFLIDAAGTIRNIYTSSYLHADTVLADIRTVTMENGPGR